MAAGLGISKDWGMEKEYLHSTRQNLWNRTFGIVYSLM